MLHKGIVTRQAQDAMTAQSMSKSVIKELLHYTDTNLIDIKTTWWHRLELKLRKH